MLNIRIERIGDQAILHCAGSIVVGKSLSALREAVLCELDRRCIVLDLSCVKRIDAGGLGMLVFLHTCTHGLGSELKLVRVSAHVAEVLELTNLNSVLTIGPAADATAGSASSSSRPSFHACA
jgi:anti-anti-sigma factor